MTPDIVRAERGSIALALLAVLVVTSVAAVVVSTNVAGQRQTAFDRGYEQSLQVADMGLERIAALAASGDAVSGQAYTGSAAGGTYTSTATQGPSGWAVRSTGTAPDGTRRTIAATVSSPVFHPVAFFADVELQAGGQTNFCIESAACIRNGASALPPELDGLAGSNELMHFNGYPSMAYGRLVLADWTANPAADARCTFNGPPISCQDVTRFVYAPDRVDILSAERLAYVEALAAACEPLPASTGVINPGTYCAESGRSLGPLDVTGSTGDVRIVVQGSGSVALAKQTNASGDPTRLQVFAPDASTVDIPNGGARIRAMIYAPVADCGGKGNLEYRGALMCRYIDTGGNASYIAPDDIGRLRYGDGRLRDWRED